MDPLTMTQALRTRLLPPPGLPPSSTHSPRPCGLSLAFVFSLVLWLASAVTTSRTVHGWNSYRAAAQDYLRSERARIRLRVWTLTSLLWCVLQSILEVFLLCLAGYILARKGVLDRPTQKVCHIAILGLLLRGGMGVGQAYRSSKGRCVEVRPCADVVRVLRYPRCGIRVREDTPQRRASHGGHERASARCSISRLRPQLYIRRIAALSINIAAAPP